MSGSQETEKAVTLERNKQSPTDIELQSPNTQASERKLLLKIDLHVLPVLWVLHFVNFMDRANIGNAKIQGMEKELHLIGQRFNIAVWVFNLGYLVMGVPLMLVFKRFGPRSLCGMMACWGIFVIGCGLVKKWQGLVTCRLLEGMAEAAFVPGAAYLVGTYYKKDEYLTRYVIFFTASIVAAAVNGFVSSLITKMDGTAGYSAWRWIFIIEGLFTVSVSFASWFLMPPFAQFSTFLTASEISLLIARTQADGDEFDVTKDHLSLSVVLHHLKDWKIWTGVLMNLGVTESANSIANFQPTILRGLGYTATQAQVHTIPVYLTGAAMSVIFAYLSERVKLRYPFYILGCAILATGLSIMIAYPKAAGVRYTGMFFMASGAYISMPISIVWTAINTGRGYKRAIALGAIVNFGTAGAFVSSNVFLFEETPRFRTGFSTGLGLCCLGAAAATATAVGCWWENRRGEAKRKVSEEGAGEAAGRESRFKFSL
ncbi:major facilitator superfamily domain-containing protein [Lophiotrema nucula]|uniref:Major facilitator superfamily domain-containing protein n=1 Tax=Lophiotrema nucula TaxID=690887 RepID=A0A6A5ZN90_9PLEO|nr:major facilitator superfamily domain-containing protein [Lophiotrema nucula]